MHGSMKTSQSIHETPLNGAQVVPTPAAAQASCSVTLFSCASKGFVIKANGEVHTILSTAS